jgi:hypothetical protein
MILLLHEAYIHDKIHGRIGVIMRKIQDNLQWN